VGAISLLFSFKAKTPLPPLTNPLFVDSAFIPFKPNVYTRWNNTSFYVESKGIPTTHNMMIGITGWQQQFPIPQCYIGANAWTIPLNPENATTPVPVNAAHFSKGAIAIAANGIPIFNPYTNTGVDAFLDGQLDNWGGHCGRADDYHYHTAPLHLYGTTPSTRPIAFGLDGYAVYGNIEPNGAAMLPLDANHGHLGTNGAYHYHGTAAAPYMIGNMVGVVTEDANFQIIPQAQANPIRPAGNPLRGAVITNCVANGTNGYTLTYTLAGVTYTVMYNWTTAGVYTFNYTNPSSTSTYNGFLPCKVTSAIHDYLGEENKSFTIFPNPTSQEFSIQLNNNIQVNEVLNTTILSATGQEVFSKNAYQSKIKTENFAKGVYFVLIKTSRGNFSSKLVIQK
jgi:hypothetical protein